ncbi:MAG: circularly permuted type 2 ATP-grasp protein, partial [Pirellulaceae bacterium]|nr:circularly permuted type 2 ATP-grasp protein [Pirellulaceae bacterium]
ARRLLRENGVTYNFYGAPQGPGRPWELDPIPLLITKREWQRLAVGLIQRATLLNRVLADLYGPRELLRHGTIPPELLYNHPGYLLPCHGIRPPGDVYLHLYAAHLARKPDGSVVVMADRTQGPSGAGYAVENRLVISRTLPSDFHRLHVERLASFFITLRDTLTALAPSGRDNPRVVLLSPGSESTAYFEDAYLARYLGYTLVEGGDLTVRGGKVFLKTLGGLLPVDVILRRTRDHDCDPLELRPDSLFGVPGLVQAARTGQVLVANALGSGVAETPALAAFLPAACRQLLGEELLLPSVPTWWCGQRQSLQHVESHLDQLIIRPAIMHRSERPILGWQLSTSQREELLSRIRYSPANFVAQEPISYSTMPAWSDSEITPLRVGLRAFAAASGGTYCVMPGGLSRAAPTSESLAESVSSGQASKDVWILSDKPVEEVSLLRPSRAALELRRSPFDLPSRVADNLYWLGRYVERTEGIIRHLRSAVVRLTNDLEPGGLTELWLLVQALSEVGESPLPASPAASQDPFEDLRSEVSTLTFDERPLGLQSSLQSLRRTATLVRDRLSLDSWRIVNQLDSELLFPWMNRRDRLGDILLLLNQMLSLLAAFSGLATENMTRGPGWQFLDMGRRIERALNSLRLVQRLLVPAEVELSPLLEAILEIFDSTMTYRYRYLTSLQLPPVLDLILIDETNPRAVGFQLNALAEHVGSLPHADLVQAAKDQQIMYAALAALRLTDLEALEEFDEGRSRGHLQRLTEKLAGFLRELSDVITHKHLTHTAASRQLSATFAVPAI